MGTSIDSDTPLLFETEGGEYTVQYKGRFLYSKRSPSSSIESLISSISSFEDTLFIFASPLLGYGLSSLVLRLQSSSFLFIVEYDDLLAKLFEETPHKWEKENVQYFHSSNMLEIIKKLDEVASFNFKKCTLIRASGGYALYQDFYDKLFQNIDYEVSNFWKNKITLIAMGRLYAKNIFKNIVNILLEKRKRIYSLQKSYIDKPILVLGAGPSLDKSYDFIKKNRSRIFLLAVDVALPSLPSLSIIPDAVLLLEGQYWVETAFLASSNRNVALFSDITSNPHVANIMTGNIFLYGSNYAKMQFLNDIKDVFFKLPFFDSLGSVGLLAIQIALFISKKDVPIFHTGLDFSKSTGFSHSKGSSNWCNLMISNNRLKTLYPCENVFLNGMIRLVGKNKEKIFSTPILQSYANIYKRLFSHLPHVFDIAKNGVFLKEVTTEELAQKYIEDFFIRKDDDLILSNNEIDRKPIMEYLKKEKEKLERLKNMLIGLEDFNEEIFLSILKTSDYLYSHFPDGLLPLSNISFLKRIRIEGETFYKIISVYENI